MQQRRPRLGDILDDYCPRERRITNHAVVAMIDDQVKQTRCSTCDSDHVYKQGKAPAPRRKKDGAPIGKVAQGQTRTRKKAADGNPAATPPEPLLPDAELVAAGQLDAPEAAEVESPIDPEDASAVDVVITVAVATPADVATAVDAAAAIDADVAVDSDNDLRDDDGPVHRPLIRATLPRPEGQSPERKNPEFTVRQPGGRGGREFDGNGPGQQRPGRGRRPMRPGQGNGAGQSRFGPPYQGNSPRHGSGQGQGQGPRQDGNRPGHPGGQRGPGRPPGEGGRGQGRKRGR